LIDFHRDQHPSRFATLQFMRVTSDFLGSQFIHEATKLAAKKIAPNSIGFNGMVLEMFRFALVSRPTPIGKSFVLQETDRWNSVGIASELVASCERNHK
jgi:hypothetical protein